MWVMLNNAFVSIVADRDNRANLLCRARRSGDLERAFGDVAPIDEIRTEAADYLFRVSLPREVVAEAMARQAEGIEYPNFKSSVADKPLHDAYMDVWQTMMGLQERVAPRGLPFLPEGNLYGRSLRQALDIARGDYDPISLAAMELDDPFPPARRMHGLTDEEWRDYQRTLDADVPF
jgi:hypothetical protein